MDRPVPTLFVLLIVCALASPLPVSAQGDYLIGDVFSDPLTTGDKGPDMVVLPAGNYTIGGVSGVEQEEDLGVVTFKNPFAMSQTEITVGVYLQFLRAVKSGRVDEFAERDPNLPVTGVSFDEADTFAAWLSHASGQHYRLPSSTEWEYAARAGTRTTYSWGRSLGQKKANCSNCNVSFEGRPAPVKTFAPNDWNLYDMHGNVWEWTKDCMNSNSRPPADGFPQLFGNCDNRELRGGSARSDGWSIRATARAYQTRHTQSAEIGIRVARDVQ